MNDRGNIKWSSMILPEHKRMLATIYEQQKDVQSPTLSEDQLEELNYKLQLAVQNRSKVIVSYMRNHRMNYKEGWVKCVDVIEQNIQLVDMQGKEVRIIFSEIVDLE